MDDIVQRLRDTWPVTVTAGEVRNDCLEAADEIERLRAALKPFAFLNEDDPKETTQEAWEMRYRDRFRDWVDFGDIEQARIALGEGS
jgi:hypothetical protein